MLCGIACLDAVAVCTENGIDLLYFHEWFLSELAFQPVKMCACACVNVRACMLNAARGCYWWTIVEESMQLLLQAASSHNSIREKTKLDFPVNAFFYVSIAFKRICMYMNMQDRYGNIIYYCMM